MNLRSLFACLMMIVLLPLSAAEFPYKKETKEGKEYYIYPVQPGEGLFAIGRKFDLTPSEIVKINPEAQSGIKSGQILLIPVKIDEAKRDEAVYTKSFHTIAPSETLYSISRKYGLTVDQLIALNSGLSATSFQIGKVIKVKSDSSEPVVSEPVRKTETIKPIVNDTIAFVEKSPLVRTELLKVALLLPFMLDVKSEEATKQSRRFLEYYEGVLLAIEQLKEDGVSVELFVYDTGSGNASTAKILRQKELSDMDLIIGPVFNENIGAIAQFSKIKAVNMVIPFTSKNDDVLKNSNMIQVNTPHQYLFSEASKQFCDRFGHHQIIFLEDPAKATDKLEFLTELKSELKRQTINFKTFSPKTADDVSAISDIITPNKACVIIPTSGSAALLSQVLPTLQSVVLNNSSYNVSLFGYPEWQTYVKDYLDVFHQLNTHIYSTFFTDPNAEDFKAFMSRFKGWYQHDIINSYPKYAILGYDTGLYFIRSLSLSSKKGYLNYLLSHSYLGIQSGFELERISKESGLINKNVYMVNYGRDFQIKKLTHK